MMKGKHGSASRNKKILAHTSTDPTKHMSKKTKVSNQGFMSDSELKPNHVSDPRTGIMKRSGGSKGMKY